MGLFERFFRKPRPNVDVAIDELPTWFGTHAEQRMRTLAQQSQTHLDRAAALKRQLATQIAAFATTKLQNENIHPKARAMMEGSRTQYIRTIQQFLAQLAIPEEADADALSAFVTEFGAQLNQLTKTTQRATAILSEFFAHAVKEIIGTFAGLEDTVHKAYPAEYRTLITLRDRIAALAEQRTGKETQAQRLAELRAQQREITGQIQKFTAEREAVRQGKEHRILVEAEQQLQKLEQTQVQRRTTISELFAPVSAVLKKLAHDGVQTEVLAPYVDDPAAALLADEGLGILDALRHAQAQLAEGNIPLKEDKAERAKRGMVTMTHELLTQHRQELHAIGDAIARLRTQIAGNVVRNHIAEANIRIAHLERQIQHAVLEQDKIQKILASEPFAQELPNIAAELSAAFDMNVQIR